MNRKAFAAGAAVMMVAVVFAGLYIVGDSPFSSGTDDSSEPETVGWTVLLYFDGDSNLAEYNQMLTNIEFLKKAPASDRVHLLVLLDRDLDGDSRAFTLEGSVETEVPLTDIDPGWTDEVNMGDPDTLVSFVRWGLENYPAYNYNIKLSDHGGGWRGICWDDTSGGDNLDLPRLKEALTSIKGLIGRNVDVLSTEACLVACAEFVYQIRDTVDYYIGSETYGFGGENTTEGGLIVGNWQFDKVYGALCSHPDMTPEDLSLTMLENFQNYGPWQGGWYIPKQQSSDTMSVMLPGKAYDLINATDALAKGLVEKLSGAMQSVNRGLIEDAIGSPEYLVREYTESYSGQLDHIGLGSFTNYDLYDFALQISGKPLGLEAQARAVMDAVEEAVLAEVHGTDVNEGEHPDSHGISIYIPQTANEYNEKYDETDLAQDTSWDEFLKAYWWL